VGLPLPMLHDDVHRISGLLVRRKIGANRTISGFGHFFNENNKKMKKMGKMKKRKKNRRTEKSQRTDQPSSV
jgi:hypothetical protein